MIFIPHEQGAWATSLKRSLDHRISEPEAFDTCIRILLAVFGNVTDLHGVTRMVGERTRCDGEIENVEIRLHDYGPNCHTGRYSLEVTAASGKTVSGDPADCLVEAVRRVCWDALDPDSAT